MLETTETAIRQNSAADLYNMALHFIDPMGTVDNFHLIMLNTA